MSFVIAKRNRNGVKVYLTRPGSLNTWSPRLANTRIFATREAAEADLCPGNEWIEEFGPCS